MERNFDEISDHIIVCGFGRVGEQASKDLFSYFSKFVIIENDVAVIKQIQENRQYLYVKGDATNDDALEMAKIESANAIITTFPSDADNLFVIVSAKALNPKIHIISRVSQKININKLLNAGANEVTQPNDIGGKHMAHLVTNPDLIEMLDALLIQSTENVNLEEIHCDTAFRSDNMSIKNLLKNTDIGINIIGIKKDNLDLIYNPRSETIINKGNILLILGTSSQIQEFKDLIEIKSSM